MIEESQIIASIAAALMVEPDEVPLDSDLETLPSYDSVSRLSLMVALSDLTGQNIEPCKLRSLKTGRDVVAYVNEGRP